MEQTERTNGMLTETRTTSYNVEASDFETDTECYGPCGDETVHGVFVEGRGYGYIVCTVCETERDWNAEEFYGDF